MDLPLDRGSDPIKLAAALRPQGFGSAPPGRIAEPVVEPVWTGLRVLAGVRDGGATLLVDGAPLTGHDRILAALGRGAGATTSGAVLDGYLTKQVATDDGIYTGPDRGPSMGRMVARQMVGSWRDRAEDAAKRLEEHTAARTFGEGEPVNLVLVDLLWLDGEWLLDVPLLERKRLLDAIVPAGDLVRPGLYVRPPIATWVGSWRAQGFSGISYKAANSRYRPGTTAKDWTTTSMPRR